MSVRARLWSAAALSGGVLLAAGCNEQQLQPFFQNDTSPPSISIVKPSGDSVDVADGLEFTVKAEDNLGLKIISVDLTGGVQLPWDTVFTTTVTTISLPVTVTFPSNTTAGGWVYIAATALDGSDNPQSARDSIFLKNVDALTVQIRDPSAGDKTAPGGNLPVEIYASQRRGVQRVGYTVRGVVTKDTSVVASGLPREFTFTDNLTIPSGAQEGAFTIRGFAVDSAGRRDSTAAITLTVESSANDTTDPVVEFTLASRVEVDDSITVKATDQSGITAIGWRAYDASTNALVTGRENDPVTGNPSSVKRTYALSFPGGMALPKALVICAYAVDGSPAANRGVTSGLCESATPAPPAGPPAGPLAVSAAAAAVGDTILVVYGVTKPLPQGGRIADAVYNRNQNEVLLTNVELDQVEVLELATQSFASAIPVGSRPWGIALWPLDTLGANADTVIVANSGGTSLSIVSVDPAGRAEQRRHHLPNFLFETVGTEIDAANNTLKISVTSYDFSDRPQYLGAFCRTSTGSQNCAADSVYALYSTTPTPAQPHQPRDFESRGTVRWENLTSAQPQSHLFWEQAEVAPSPRSDTIQIIADRGPSVPFDTVLSAACGITATSAEVAFLDTTYVRNSGNFTHGLIGEGGGGEAVLGYARAIGYATRGGVTSAACSMTLLGVSFSGRIERDRGISPAIRVRDFVINTASAVKAIAINFNGLTNLIRADSVYVLDEGLRLQGLLQVSAVNSGMDLNFDHDFNARDRTSPTGRSPNDRLLFTATPNAEIDVFDTFYYGNVATIPIKDPVIGPLRGAQLPSGEQILVGVTANGVVVVTLPATIIANPFPIEQWGAPGH